MSESVHMLNFIFPSQRWSGRERGRVGRGGGGVGLIHCAILESA